MKKLLLFFIALFISTSQTSAASLSALQDADAFVIAKSIKLGEVELNLKTGNTVNHSCKVGEFFDIGSCRPCGDAMTGCLECLNGQTCTKCDAGYLRNSDNKCVKSACSKDEDCEQNQVCKNAGKTNAICEDIICSANEYAENGKCNLCSTAISHCTKCTDSTKCEICQDGYALTADFKCEPIVCKPTEYLEGDLCLPCADVLSNCEKCSNKTTCTICKAGYSVVEGQCVPALCNDHTDCADDELCFNAGTPEAYCEKVVCAEGQYLFNRACFDCGPNCKQCQDENLCLVCNTGYTVVNGKCEPTVCDEGQYLKDDLCKDCSETLSDCIACYDAETCLMCADDTFKIVNGKCTKKTCTEMNSTYTTACGTGFVQTPTGFTGNDGACFTCSPASCSITGYGTNAYKSLGLTQPTCSTASEWYMKTLPQSGGFNCYACVCDGTTFGGGGCCSGGKVTCGGTEGPCRECCNNDTNICGIGKKCSNYQCILCDKGEKCFCPGDKVADGKGGCEAPAGSECSTYTKCKAGQACYNGKCTYCSSGSNTAQGCFCNAPAKTTGSKCSCPEGYIGSNRGAGVDFVDCYKPTEDEEGSTGYVCPSDSSATYSNPKNCPEGYGWNLPNDCSCVMRPQGSNLNNYTNCPTNKRSTGQGHCTPLRCNTLSCGTYSQDCRIQTFYHTYSRGTSTQRLPWYMACSKSQNGLFDSCGTQYCYQ